MSRELKVGTYNVGQANTAEFGMHNAQVIRDCIKMANVKLAEVYHVIGLRCEPILNSISVYEMRKRSAGAGFASVAMMETRAGVRGGAPRPGKKPISVFNQRSENKWDASLRQPRFNCLSQARSVAHVKVVRYFKLLFKQHNEDMHKEFHAYCRTNRSATNWQLLAKSHELIADPKGFELFIKQLLRVVYRGTWDKAKRNHFLDDKNERDIIIFDIQQTLEVAKCFELMSTIMSTAADDRLDVTSLQQGCELAGLQEYEGQAVPEGYRLTCLRDKVLGTALLSHKSWAIRRLSMPALSRGITDDNRFMRHNGSEFFVKKATYSKALLVEAKKAGVTVRVAVIHAKQPKNTDDAIGLARFIQALSPADNQPFVVLMDSNFESSDLFSQFAASLVADGRAWQCAAGTPGVPSTEKERNEASTQDAKLFKRVRANKDVIIALNMQLTATATIGDLFVQGKPGDHRLVTAGFSLDHPTAALCVPPSDALIFEKHDLELPGGAAASSRRLG